MKAFILLCLLHSAFGQNPFTWSPEDSQDASRECRRDQGSCGCCKMLLELEDLKDYINKNLTQLENESMAAISSYDDLIYKHTAFSGAISTDDYKGCTGPYGSDELIKYQHVFINLNNAYDTTTGIFTALYSGVYNIAFTVYSDAGAPMIKLEACAVLEHNQQPVAGMSDINRNDQEDQSAHVVALLLEEGDTVAVKLPAGCFLCDEKSRYNTFSVFLLYATG